MGVLKQVDSVMSRRVHNSIAFSKARIAFFLVFGLLMVSCGRDLGPTKAIAFNWPNDTGPCVEEGEEGFGYRITTGLDSDGNEILDENEVETVTWVCVVQPVEAKDFCEPGLHEQPEVRLIREREASDYLVVDVGPSWIVVSLWDEYRLRPIEYLMPGDGTRPCYFDSTMIALMPGSNYDHFIRHAVHFDRITHECGPCEPPYDLSPP